MTSDGTNTYLWDAENKLFLRVNYSGPNDYTSFRTDANFRLVEIIETTGGITTSDRNFVNRPDLLEDINRWKKGNIAGATVKRFFLTWVSYLEVIRIFMARMF
ncbi:MAG: hypothetical protein IPI39_15130 [Candidatus Obscuribacter sp.]|nr:hypothetical protein [Candidatus Obscuribacter sp.]